jgi:capsular exopolysaccharide synthesis family protein
MKRLNSTNYNTDSLEIESSYPIEYKGIYTDGYYGSVNRDGEKTLLRGFFTTLYNHWLLILSLTLLVTGATIVYVAQKPDFYKSQARVQVNAENNPAAGSRNGGNPIIVNNQANDPAYFTTQLQILEGAGLLRKVIKTLDLENNQNFLNPQSGKELTAWQNVRKMFGLYRPAASVQPSSVTSRSKENSLRLKPENSSLDSDEETERLAPLVATLKRNLIITPVKDSRTKNAETRLIDIEYTHQDPVIATKIANTIADVYVLQNLEQKIQTNASASDFLQKRVGELQSDIREGEERLINYAKNNQIVSLDDKQNTVVQRFTDLSQKLGQAENDRIAAQTAYQAAMQNKMRSSTAETRDPQVNGLETRLNELRQKLAQLKTEYTDEWYEVVQTKKQIESVENQLGSLRKRASDIQISTLEERLNEATAREKELRNNFNTQREEVIRQSEAAINYKIIQQEINTNKGLLDAILQRSRENDVILNDTPNNVLVVDRALVSNSPVGPERKKNIILAFLVSLSIGCGLAFLMDWLDDSVHNSENVENELGLPLLATIPKAPMSLGNRFRLSNFALTRKARVRKNLYNPAVFETPAFLEAYLHLRTHLTLSTSGGAPQSILVTSGEEGEGKTVTAMNLAASLSKNGSKILLIDADLRCPRIHLIKELNNDYGLTALLTAKEVTDELLDMTIQKDNSGNLHILTAGERCVNPANLLCSEEMRSLLMNLSGKYTHIIIDSPPVLYFADSTILSTLVDSVIIVVHDNKSSKLSVQKAKKVLQAVGARVIGMVLNGIQWHQSNYSKYHYYELDAEVVPEGDQQFLKLN